MVDATRERSGNLSSNSAEGEDPDCEIKVDGDREVVRDNLVGGATTKILILHEGLPDPMQPVLLEAKVEGSECDDAIQLLNEYEHVFVGPDGKVGRISACDGHRRSPAHPTKVTKGTPCPQTDHS